MESVDQFPSWRVNGYVIHRLYGGPEEGGWWYDQYEPTGQTWGPFASSGEAWGWIEDNAHLEEEQNVGQAPLHSVLSDGLFQLVAEQGPALRFPERAPRYE